LSSLTEFSHGAASYYTAFFSVAFVVYFLRKRGYKSLPEAINVRYGSLATVRKMEA
jgi:Na+/proline symporter